MNPQAETASESLGEYIRQAWSVVEPGVQFVPGWHIEAISEHLEALTRGEIRNLIINIPPRHMKSISISVMWPTWAWIKRPSAQFLTASYSMNLAVRDAVKSRRLIQSPWYQSRWADRFQLAGDQNQKSRYENNKNGHRIAVGVGGGATGEGGDFIVVDDPHKAQEADSDAYRTAVLDWWDYTMSTRLNNPKAGGRVIIMQRLHEEDLTGHVLARMKDGGEQYEHLCLPAEYEPRCYVTVLGWSDPRTVEGELLWPERFGAVELATLKKTLGERQAAGQLQQRPAPAGGAIFKRDWWHEQNRYDYGAFPWSGTVARWLSFDTALKDRETNDYTAFGVYELTREYKLLKRHAWWDRVEFPQLATVIQAEAQRWNGDGKLRGVIIEDKGSGISAIQTLRQSAPPEIAQLLIAFNPMLSKEGRARQASLWCERGCVLLPEPSDQVPWLFDFEDMLFKFPGAAHDDPVDEFTQAILYLENFLAEGYRLS